MRRDYWIALIVLSPRAFHGLQLGRKWPSRLRTRVVSRHPAVAIPITEGEATEYSTFLSEHVQSPKFHAPNYSKATVSQLLTSASSRGGLNGLGIPSSTKQWPSKPQVLEVIPKPCFEKNTLKSLLYALGSLGLTLSLGAAAAAWIPSTLLATPLWVTYAIAAGTAATGCWVVAHECGHGAFSANKSLQRAVGFVLHSCLLVPYFSWQRTHAIHHLNTNHMTEGETHVPPVVGSQAASDALKASRMLGPRLYPIASMFVHLILGWPLYILQGATGGPKYGATSHFWPWGHSGAKLKGGKELFPTPRLKRSVLVSSLGVGAVLLGLSTWASKVGLARVALLYGAPLVVVNAWLVLYTWLQHTDVDVAHFDENEHTWVKGAFQTIDRPYGRVLNLLHHGIGSTHVLHHVCSTVPHYHAWEATEALKTNFPELYLHDPTPIHKALWRVARDCIAVEKLPGKAGSYVFTSPQPS